MKRLADDAARAAGRGREARCRHRRQPEGAWVWRVSGRCDSLRDFDRCEAWVRLQGRARFTTSLRGDVLLTPGNFATGGGFKADKFKYYDGDRYPQSSFFARVTCSSR